MLDTYTWAEFGKLLAVTAALYYGWWTIRFGRAGWASLTGLWLSMRKGAPVDSVEQPLSPAVLQDFRGLLGAWTPALWKASEKQEFIDLLAAGEFGALEGNSVLTGFWVVHLTSIAQARNWDIGEGRIRELLGVGKS